MRPARVFDSERNECRGYQPELAGWLPPRWAGSCFSAAIHGTLTNSASQRAGARVGDLFMSLIHTCELNGANPFDYLIKLQRHAEELKHRPSEWMPWNYRETVVRLAASAAA